MEITDEEFGGTRVTLEQGDSLKAVPRSHRKLITPEIEAWWADPVVAIRRVADWAVAPNMGRWFRRMADDGTWRLRLHKASGVDFTAAGFDFGCDGIRGAEVTPPPGKLTSKRFPQELSNYHRLVGKIDWMGFGAAGGMTGLGNPMPLTAFAFDYHGADVDLDRTFVFGGSACGDMLVFTTDGRGGWLNLGGHEIRLIGSVTDTIDWVYGELLAGRGPDYHNLLRG
jgi:hypothetical protein